MGRIPSGITWFDDDKFIGSNVVFQEPNYSVWRLDKKVSEHEIYEVEVDAKMPGGGSEARAVFFCSRLDRPVPQEAVMKIRMQSWSFVYAILFSWKKDKQDRHMWVPGGYILYILMEKLPGFSPERFYVDLDRAEHDELRSKFKEAWLECRDCGVINADPALRNLLWDREKKCYIIDFELWQPPTKKDV